MLYRRPNSPYWWCRFTLGGQRIRRSTETADRRQAQDFEVRLREQLWGRVHGGDRTWTDATKRWIDEKDTKRSADRDRIIIAWTLPRIGDDLLQDITRDRLLELRTEKAAETSKSTANRYLALIRSVLNAAARDWGWLKNAPKVPLFPAGPTDYQWLTPAEFTALLEHLPPHTRQLARFAVATGLRRTNITHLRWSQVDMRRRHAHVRASETKAGKALTVPLNAMAMAVLRQQKGAHAVWVFPYKGEPVWQVSTKAWRAAATAIGKKGLRFHDLRHTWASWHVQAGTPLNALQALGGWADLQMVQRYGHLDARSLRDYAAAGGAFRGTYLAHAPKTARAKRAK